MNGIQVTKPAGIKWNRLLDSVVTILEYKNSIIDHVIYTKVFTYGTVSYLTFPLMIFSILIIMRQNFLD